MSARARESVCGPVCVASRWSERLGYSGYIVIPALDLSSFTSAIKLSMLCHTQLINNK